ncbi:hypothetical protein, partial [Bacillus amyloliquefaciens]|uniref:hypothetical protein n=1 Tax=Bacillus amyloliquefaciens TaxID=1390 RepID=UPI002852975E
TTASACCTERSIVFIWPTVFATNSSPLPAVSEVWMADSVISADTFAVSAMPALIWDQDVKEGLDITDQTAESFKKISEMTTQISGALQHMNGTLEQLAAGSQNVTNAVEDIT